MQSNAIKRAVCYALLIVCLGGSLLNLLLPFAFFSSHGPISALYYLQMDRNESDWQGMRPLMFAILLLALLTAAALAFALVRAFRSLDRENLLLEKPESAPVPGLRRHLSPRLSLGIGPALSLGLNAALFLLALFILPDAAYFQQDYGCSVPAVPLIGMILPVCALRLCRVLNQELPE